MKRAAALAATFVCALLLPRAAAAARPSMEDVVRATFAIHDLEDVSISPSGTAVAWQETMHNLQGLTDVRHHTALYIAAVHGSTQTRLTAGNGARVYDEEEPVWSPDGTQIAFLSDARSKGKLQIYIADARGLRARRLGTLDGNVQHLTWAPDGSAVAVLYTANAHRQTGALAPGSRDVGLIGSVTDEQRLATVNVHTAVVRPLTPANAYVYEYSWSPDGRRLTYTYALGNGDDNWWIAKLAVIGADGSHQRDVFAPRYQINDPQWSPDGTSIAFIGGIMSDFGSVGGDVYALDVASDSVRDVAPGMPYSATSLRWIDHTHLFMTAHDKGSLHLYELDTARGSIATLTARDETLRSLSVAHGGRQVALVRASFDAPPEVWAGTPPSLSQVSHSNAHAQRLYGKAESIAWKSDQFTIQGWLIYPSEYDPQKRYPMITLIHGGPSAAWTPVFGARNVAALSSRGYFVFEPNPRGSYGQGEAFTSANVKDFGYGDWRDDLAGVDASLKAAPIDPERLGLFGWSYGGYMAMWAETQTQRFKAIVAGAGVVNWQSYYGQNKIDTWMLPFFGASVYDDPAVYAKSSPITFIKNSKTPVLILQGELDEEVPAPQSFEFWHAMKTLDVPTQLMVYEGEGHAPRTPLNQIDMLQRIVDWFGRYTSPQRR